MLLHRGDVTLPSGGGTTTPPTGSGTGAITGLGGKCVDVAATNSANGAAVQLYDCNGTNAQKWSYSSGRLINTGSGRCLDATGQSSADATRLQIWDCTGNANQSWTLPS